MDIAITVSNRELSPAVVNFFQHENQTVTLTYTLDSYMYGDVDLRNYKAYAVTSQNGLVDMTELTKNYDSTHDKLTLTWLVEEYSLRQEGAITYQIVFKEDVDDGENTAVFYTYKGIMINRGSVDGDNHITANYPTILKQWLDRMDDIAGTLSTAIIYIPYGETIPSTERVDGRIYFQFTDSYNTEGRFEDHECNELNLSAYLPLSGGTMTGSIDMNHKSISGVRQMELRGTTSDNHGGYLDFHYNDSSEDYTSRIIEGSSGRLDFTAPNGVRANSKQVVTSVDGVDANASGNVALNAVRTSGDQNIGGNKVFTSNFYKKAASSSLTDTSRTNVEYSGLGFQDKNGNNSSYFEEQWKTDGSRWFGLVLRNNTNNGWEHPIRYIVPAYSTTLTKGKLYGVTPEANSDSTELVTTEWVRDNAVMTSGNQTVAGVKTFTGDSVYKQGSYSLTDNPPTAQQSLGGYRVKDSSGNVVVKIAGYVGANGEKAVADFYATKGNSNAGFIVQSTGDTTTSSMQLNGITIPSNSDSSQVATTEWVNDKLETYVTDLDLENALSNDVVKTSGNQTISGAKTFTTNSFWTGTNPVLQLKNTNVTFGTAPSANQHFSMIAKDKDGNDVGIVRITQSTDGKVATQLLARNKTSNGDIYEGGIGVYVSDNGYVGATAPHPETGANGVAIATTKWVNDTITAFQPAINNISSTSGTVTLQTNKVYKMTISGTTTFSLPSSVDTSKHNQIKIFVRTTTAATINWGASRYFNATTPSIGTGYYEFYFDYHSVLGGWVAGALGC